jgi:hypothetical protein
MPPPDKSLPGFLRCDTGSKRRSGAERKHGHCVKEAFRLEYSLDRIDSSGHYERRNLQVVCKFINQWKGATDNEEFKRLIALVRG